MRSRKLLVVLATMIALVLVSSPANAQTRVWHDAVGDTSEDGLADIGTVKVSNTKKTTKVTVRIPREQPAMSAFGETRVYLDTDKKKAGPEYLWLVSYPGESTFVPVKRNKPQYSKAWYGQTRSTKCAKTVKVNFSAPDGVFGITVKHKSGCLGNPKSVRTNIRTTVFGHFNLNDYDDETTYATPEVDYYPTRSGFTASVKR
jgi:hypothetical protein